MGLRWLLGSLPGHRRAVVRPSDLPLSRALAPSASNRRETVLPMSSTDIKWCAHAGMHCIRSILQCRPVGSTAETMAAWRSPLGCTQHDLADAAFLTWCATNGVKLPQCQIKSLAETGRCVVATTHIPCGKVVVEVPDEAVLMSENSPIAELLAAECLTKETAIDDVYEVTPRGLHGPFVLNTTDTRPSCEQVQGIILAVMHEKHCSKHSKCERLKLSSCGAALARGHHLTPHTCMCAGGGRTWTSFHLTCGTCRCTGR
jgi:hypothetical protein